MGLTGLSTTGGAGVRDREQPGHRTPRLYVWGLQLTQVGTYDRAGGSAVGDLGAEMYDWSARQNWSATTRPPSSTPSGWHPCP